MIFDQSIRSEVYLEFLANLPSEFRGDVLLIRKRGRSFLSSSSRADGRFLYDMIPRDVRFYISTILPGQSAAPPEDSYEFTPTGEALEQTTEAGWPETSIPAKATITPGNESTGILPFAAVIGKDRHKPKRAMQLR